MKILVCGDIHLCPTSSIVRGIGKKYTQRLHNCVNSLNWVEDISVKNNCELEVFLGDTFDSSALDAETVTAASEVLWNDTDKVFLVGNHEASNKSLLFNSVNGLSTKNKIIITRPELFSYDNFDALFLPYIKESDRKSLLEYIENSGSKNSKRIIFSHNDIKGLQYGKFLSEEGFEISEIESSCSLFLNGHLHNGSKFCSNGFNVGNLTGQNFTEDSYKYSHEIFIIDTNKNDLEVFENPYAFNFYKCELKSEQDINSLSELKNNSVVSLKTELTFKDLIVGKVEELKASGKISEVRIIFSSGHSDSADTKSLDSESINVNHLDEFYNFALSQLGESKELMEELNMICHSEV